MAIFLKRILIFKGSTPRLQVTSQLVFIKRLYQLLQDGYPLINALQSLKWDKKMSFTADLIISKLKAGHHIDEAFNYGKFHEMIVSTLYFTRINGDLLKYIKQSIEVFEQHLLNRQKFSQIIRYPLVLSTIFLILIYFIKSSILPSFMHFFQLNASSTQSVLLFISIINSLLNGFLLLSILCLFIYLTWLYFRKKLTVKQKIMFISKTPIVNYLMTMKTSHYFANYFSNFLKAGMSYKEILLHMEKQTKLSIIAHYAGFLKEALSVGLPIHEQIYKLSLLDKQLIEIFSKNINQQVLEQDLSSFANIIYDKMQERLIRLMTLVQPVFFIVLAGFIIFIYATLMWPMFEFIKSM